MYSHGAICNAHMGLYAMHIWGYMQCTCILICLTDPITLYVCIQFYHCTSVYCTFPPHKVLHHPHTVTPPHHEWGTSWSRRDREDWNNKGPGQSPGSDGVRVQLLWADGLQGRPLPQVLKTLWVYTINVCIIHVHVLCTQGILYTQLMPSTACWWIFITQTCACIILMSSNCACVYMAVGM